MKYLRSILETKPFLSVPVGDDKKDESRRSKEKLDSDLRKNIISPNSSRRERALNGRNNSDSSSRGRMGSPSGKSNGSSDSEQSWGCHYDKKDKSSDSPVLGRSRLGSGETRLDRLVRRPSSNKNILRQTSNDSLPPALPKPNKKTKEKHEKRNHFMILLQMMSLKMSMTIIFCMKEEPSH